METKILIDTDVLINLLRGDVDTENLIQNIKSNKLFTTDINVFELYHGVQRSKNKENDLNALEILLSSLMTISTDKASMIIASRIIADLEKNGKTVDLADLFIAAICVSGSFSLLTKNKKHFEKIKELKFIEI